ncbi:unnamed protein product [Periconia digitata]|uniref:Topoisomerase 6 subunit A/Spo11 TOPRIM domain-containing protein n=1 Tax=Periconia digitata TaxID=1303443 RepID=A0A9W4U701_9PLEO|nr:unnamed protein product [Periconia digitata]
MTDIIQGALVPKLHAEDILDLAAVRWILIIEKEVKHTHRLTGSSRSLSAQATFRTLLSSSQWRALGAQGLVLTAKGYPDLASRSFLRHIADENPHIPTYALVDFDPDGIAIMSTYKHGSYRLAHEDVSHNQGSGLRLPGLQWLGVQSHHITNGRADRKLAETTTLADTQGLMRLTARDRQKAHRMLEWDLCAEGGLEAKWRVELQRMLMLNIKAEMQILDEVAGNLVSWLGSELEARSSRGAGSDQAAASPLSSGDELLF